MAPTIRPATINDAPAMAAILNDLIAQGGTTAYRDPFNPDQIIGQFLASHFAISCFCARDAGQVIGFQALEWSDPDWPGPDRLPADWAIISTYVALDRQGQGIGRALFEATRAAAETAGAHRIDATIRRENAGGRAYYAHLGFTDYREFAEAVSMVLRV